MRGEGGRHRAVVMSLDFARRPTLGSSLASSSSISATSWFDPQRSGLAARSAVAVITGREYPQSGKAS